MKTKFNRFGTSGCYHCGSCGRKTRETDPDSASVELCSVCYEMSGLENLMSDTGETPARLAEWEALVAECRKRGGQIDAAKWWRPTEEGKR